MSYEPFKVGDKVRLIERVRYVRLNKNPEDFYAKTMELTVAAATRSSNDWGQIMTLSPDPEDTGHCWVGTCFERAGGPW